MTDRLAVRALLDEAIGAYDRPRAVDVALTAIDDGSLTIEELYRILSEIMVDIGEAWQRGSADVLQEHLASGVVRTIVESCALRVEQAAPASRTATVILAAPSEEYHDLGLRMLTEDRDVCRANGCLTRAVTPPWLPRSRETRRAGEGDPRRG